MGSVPLQLLMEPCAKILRENELANFLKVLSEFSVNIDGTMCDVF